MDSSSSQNGVARLGIWATVIVAVVGAFVWVGTVASDVKQNATAVAAIGDRVKAIESAQLVNSLLISQVQRDAREVETQFCATDVVRNLMHANDMRIMSMVWKKTFDVEIPTNNAYYPQICNRPIDSGK